MQALTRFALLFSLLIACVEPTVLAPLDPKLAANRAALGPEDPNVPAGPLHRPGQPCLACHYRDGDGREYSVAGTVYRDLTSKVVLADVEVLFIDTRKNRFTARTNCAGNFYVTPAELTPVVPYWVSVRFGNNEVVDMESPIHLDGSCASCHTNPVSPTSAGQVFVVADELMAGTVVARACRPGEEKAVP